MILNVITYFDFDNIIKTSKKKKKCMLLFHLKNLIYIIYYI